MQNDFSYPFLNSKVNAANWRKLSNLGPLIKTYTEGHKEVHWDFVEEKKNWALSLPLKHLESKYSVLYTSKSGLRNTPNHHRINLSRKSVPRTYIHIYTCIYVYISDIFDFLKSLHMENTFHWGEPQIYFHCFFLELSRDKQGAGKSILLPLFWGYKS